MDLVAGTHVFFQTCEARPCVIKEGTLCKVSERGENVIYVDYGTHHHVPVSPEYLYRPEDALKKL